MRSGHVEHLAELISRCNRSSKSGGRCVVVTGAGCSTESGIPDYRGPQGHYRREGFVPLTYQHFMKDDSEKRRYWARSMLGYSTMSGASCNPTHMALHALWRSGMVSHIITQNVDGLHHLATHGGVGGLSVPEKYTMSSSAAASAAALTEIHGNIHLVVCIKCGDISLRSHLQERLQKLNPALHDKYASHSGLVRPDGDFSAPAEVVQSMRLAMCLRCNGYLKPHVVLFGENVPHAKVSKTCDLVTSASTLLCVGTSLQVFSAFRYVRLAHEKHVPVAIVNNGKTRADDSGDVLKIDTDSTARTISHLASLLGA